MTGLPGLDEARRQLTEFADGVARRGLVHGAAGNLSVRVAGGMVITARGVDLGVSDLSRSPFVRFGTSLRGIAPEPSSETPMHAAIYQRLEAGAIVHTHSMAAVALSTVVHEVPPLHYYMTRLGDSLRVAPYATFGSIALAENVVTALDGRHGALMANHGAIAIGDTLAEAFRRAELIEWLCELHLRAIAVGEPRILSPSELDDVRRQRGARTGDPC